VLTVKQAAERLGVSSQVVYALCASKALRHSRVGLRRGTIRISEEALAQYLKGREVGTAAPPPTPPPRPSFKFSHLRP